VPADVAAYAPLAAPFFRDLAANKVLEKIKQDLAMIDMQFLAQLMKLPRRNKRRGSREKWKPVINSKFALPKLNCTKFLLMII